MTKLEAVDKIRVPEYKILDFLENLFEKLAKLCEIVYNKIVWVYPQNFRISQQYVNFYLTKGCQ